ncbi:hypothetical protein ABFS82_11G092200 [Erythranthe guttata]|nr:PREDICTED: calcium uniporter protein 2, mitochondrial-like [Erythranthe guttata]|eukprot:XP_012835067.1 PREDICTED: calcium uniporter protein 2, mitochondrial-like [Erythranthe guttata]
MAFRKTITQRLFSLSRMANTPAVTNCRTSSPCSAAKSASLNHPSKPNGFALDPGDDGIFRRYIHRNSAAAASPSAIRYLPTGEKLLEKLREMDISKDRIRLDGLIPPPAEAEAEMEAELEESPEANLTVADAKKILKLSQLETVKSRLKTVENDVVSYSEFLEICDNVCSSTDQSLEFAKILDESGTVIVLGNIVFLKPQQVMKAITGLLPLTITHTKLDDPRKKELQEMEKQKSTIDIDADLAVKREFKLGLGYLVVQTAAFMRLTFWELSWDVMEPICFFVTSTYFMGAYGYFMRTSKEPSFEGFYQSRFGAKQKRLMKARDFDFERYSELKKACSSS